MKKLVLLAVMLMVFGVMTLAQASLIDLGNGVTKDDRGTLTVFDDQYWLQDTNTFEGMTYNEQVAAIAIVHIPGLTDITNWHMATYSDILNIWNQYAVIDWLAITGAFTPSSTYADGSKHWVGRYDRIFYSSNPNDPNAPYHYEVNMDYSATTNNYNGGLDVGTSDAIAVSEMGAFATAYHLPASVPEPTTMLLLGLGLMGLAQVRRKFQK